MNQENLYYDKNWDLGLDEPPEEWDNIIQEYESYARQSSEE